jgi:hypothetical protein
MIAQEVFRRGTNRTSAGRYGWAKPRGSATPSEKNSMVVITPAHLELLNRQVSPDEMSDLTRILVIAGETLLAESRSQWRDFAPQGP